MASFFDPKKWYWYVGDDRARGYSSEAGDYVSNSDVAFTTWRGTNLPGLVDTESNLGQVLAKYIPDGINPLSTVFAIQQPLKQAQLDQLLIQKADNVNMVKGGSSSTTTGTGVANYLSASTNNYRSLRAQIAAATTVGGVRAIDINAGWPNNP